MNLELIFDQAHYKTLLRPDVRAEPVLILKGQHSQGSWDDERLRRLQCELRIECVEHVCRVDWNGQGWDKGGYFTKRSRTEWIAMHGEASCLGRALIRKNLSPEMDETYGPIGFPLEVGLMLLEEDVMDIITQIRFGLSFGLKTHISLKLGSDALPKRFTYARDLDVSEDLEYPIVDATIEEVTG